MQMHAPVAVVGMCVTDKNHANRMYTKGHRCGGHAYRWKAPASDSRKNGVSTYLLCLPSHVSNLNILIFSHKKSPRFYRILHAAPIYVACFLYNGLVLVRSTGVVSDVA